MDEAAQEAVATARAYAGAAGATRVVLLIDRGDERPALMVEVDHDGTAEVTDGDHVETAPPTADGIVPDGNAAGGGDTAGGLLLPDVRAIPHTAIRLDLQTGELSAPIGAIEHLADSLKALAGGFGGRSVATAVFPTRDPDIPIAIAAREGEPAVLTAGDEQYELPN